MIACTDCRASPILKFSARPCPPRALAVRTSTRRLERTARTHGPCGGRYPRRVSRECFGDRNLRSQTTRPAAARYGELPRPRNRCRRYQSEPHRADRPKHRADGQRRGDADQSVQRPTRALDHRCRTVEHPGRYPGQCSRYRSRRSDKLLWTDRLSRQMRPPSAAAGRRSGQRSTGLAGQAVYSGVRVSRAEAGLCSGTSNTGRCP